jgi:hypothetical protein
MTRTLLRLAALALVAQGGTALAQAGSGPAPGTGDSRRATAESREAQAEYNKVMGGTDRKARKAKAVPATAADIVAGARVEDRKGVPIGAVESADATGAIVSTGVGRVRVPLEGFGKNARGLVLGITKAEFDSLVAAATAPAKPKG